LSLASPAAGSPEPLICLYGDARAAAPAPASRLAVGLDCVESSATDPLSALRAAAALHPERDLVLLARDAHLPPHWWPRLRAARDAAPAAGVLSPLAGGGSFDPRPTATSLDDDALDSACWALSERQLWPVGQWSAGCSYWRVAALAALPREGSGRALPPGIEAVLLDHLRVGGALGDDGADPAAVPAVVLALRERLRDVVAAMPYLGLDGRPVVLHVLHGWGGGAQRFVEDLAHGDTHRHHLVLLARGDAQREHGHGLALHADLRAAPLRQWPLSAPFAATALASSEYRALLARIVADFGVGAVLVSSLIGHSLDALRSGLPTAVVCHDYYPLWPRLHADFGDSRLDFSAAAIDAALAGPPAGFEFGEIRPDYWRALRAAYLDALAQADATLIAPSATVEANLRRIEPALAARRWHRIEHGLAPFPAAPSPIVPDPGRRALRIVMPGRLRGGKGEDLLAALLPLLPDGIELVLLGGGAAAMRFFGRRGVHIVLDYERDALPAQLAALRPDAALLASTVAETYSYLLSELWTLGVPVIATRRGSFVERIEDGRTGLLVDPAPKALAELLGALRENRAPLEALRAAAPPPLPTLAQMAERHRAALPAAVHAPALPALQHDARALRQELRAADSAQRLLAAEQRLAQLAAELTRRAEWAQAQEKLAAERTRWAKQAQAQADAAMLHAAELEREVEARGVWARSLVAEAEELRGLVASEQQRLEAELQHERQVFARLAAEHESLLHSFSWRVTRPVRWLRRRLTSAAFQARRVASLQHRLVRSLKSRGVGATVARIRQKLQRGGPPAAALVMPQAQDEALPVLQLPDAPRASVIVPVYNHFHHTRTCLQALAACGDATPFEIIVVDDGSADETAARLAGLAGLRFHRNPQNLGFIGACNAGAALARGEFLVFLNNDTAVQPGWLDALLATFAQHADVGLAGSKLVYPDGRLQEAGGIVFSDGSGWNYGRFDDPADPRYNFVREVDYCSGAAIAIRKPLFERFGGFDAHYAPAYYEDTDLAMKVRQAGLRVLYQPASVVVHFEGVTSGTDTAGSGTKRYQVVNQAKFLERWRETLATHPAPGTEIARARQHRDRRHVLMIDATTPQPDHDSGSLRLVNAMRVLRAEGCAITFFSESRVWVERYTAELQQLGVEVLWHPWLSDPVRWFAEHGRRFDLVFISRHYVASSYLGLVRLHAPQARLVFDTVDLHYLREQREAELTGRADLAHAADVTRSKELTLIRSADLTLVVSPVEQELLRREAPGARVEVLSNVHEVFGRRREFGERRDLMFMGGYQHPPNVDAAIWFVDEIFPRVRARLPEVRFHLIGSLASDEIRALGERDGVQFQGYVADLDPFLDGCRLAVAPLRYGAGVKGKVNMSMSYGQPVVATPIAVEGMYTVAGRDVLVAQDAQAFADEIVRAYEDEALWTSLSDHGLENVRQHFSFDAARAAVRRMFV
jgi:O-antigen biosynthesis protein